MPKRKGAMETVGWASTREFVVGAGVEAFSKLPVREQTILHLRFGMAGEAPMSLGAVGWRLKPQISRERVRQLEHRALKSLRKHVGDGTRE